MSGWVRFDNTMPDNIKIAPLTDRGFRLWVNAICYCSRAQSDGFIPLAVLPALYRSGAKRVAAELVGVGLLDEVAGGYRVHDYLDFNPSRARLNEIRESSRRTTARWRDKDVTRHEEDGDASVTDHPHARDRSVPLSLFSYWQEKCGKSKAKLTRERRQKIEARLAEGYTPEQIRQAIDGAARGAFVNDEGKRFDDLELICRNGSKLESFIDRATVVSLPSRDPALERMDAWKRGYPSEAS